VLSEDMKRVVRGQRLGFVATVAADGSPCVSPKGTTTVWDDEHLVFADIRSPGTVANLERDPRVEVNVVDPIVRKGYRFAGRATVHRVGRTFDDVVAFYGREYDLARERIRSVVLIRVERALAVVSPAYDTGATEKSVRARWAAHHGVAVRGMRRRSATVPGRS